MLPEKFENYISKNNLFNKQDKILLALSGGCDSTALFQLLKNLNYKFSAAHCNFNLRNKDSDDDELFVKKLCKNSDIQLFNTSFNTKKFAETNKLSIEDAARKLRYSWFEKIRSQNNFSYILTAHHLDDRIESFFINLTKGTGIKGLRSILPKNNFIVRPLLFAKKEEIENYCINNNIQYRTDQSNYDTYFLRNKFRHEILPVLKKINPKFQDSMVKNFHIYNEFENIYNDYIETKKKFISEVRKNLIYIDLEKLLKSLAPLSLLFEIIRPYGFKSSQCRHILNNINNLQTGKLFFSKTHRILKDTKYLIIDTLKIEKNEIFYFDKEITHSEIPIKLSFSYSDIIPSEFKTDKDTALVDADRISYPLIIRKYKKGDRFNPFGMKGEKMLSDFFTDNKINLFERENIWILTTKEDEIIWIIGYRTDNKFKINENTKKILQIKRL